ncbi:MAG: glycosyltransferase family 4 protein [Lachnospiraceae bacterium]|nr:glycosyltransferase family 4 protein [Lachnospiraceae bacterium]
MRILLINHYAGSPEMGMEFRPYYFAREWIKMGHQVDIIAADYSHLRTGNPEVGADFETEDIDGIRYHWIKTGKYEGNGAKRALTMFRFVGKLWRKAGKIVQEYAPDVVITSSTYPLDTYGGQRIAKKAKAKLIHEVHDMWPATLIELGGMSRYHPFVVVMQMAENSFCRKSDHVVSLLPHAKEYFVAHGMREDKFVTIANGIVKEDWDNPEPLPEEHRRELEKLKEEKRFIVGYFGGHALSNALDVMLDAAKRTAEKEIRFVLVGGGTEKGRLIRRAEEEKIENVLFLPPVPKKSVPELVKYFDCSVICAMTSPLYRFGVCLNKMYDSMMAAKPVLFAMDAPATPIEEYGCGILVRSGREEKIAEAVERLYRMKEEERQEMGRRGRQAVFQHFTYDILAERFESLFERQRV